MCIQNPETDYSFELYKVLIDETRNLHTQWINNFRVILTFNSILLAALIAIIVMLGKGEITNCNFKEPLHFILVAISISGILVTLIGIRLIWRLHISYRLRYSELLFIETKLSNKLPLLPFYEGYKRFKSDKTFFKNHKIFNKDHYSRSLNEIVPITFRFVNGFWGYILISCVCIAAYTIILLLLNEKMFI